MIAPAGLIILLPLYITFLKDEPFLFLVLLSLFGITSVIVIICFKEVGYLLVHIKFVLSLIKATSTPFLFISAGLGLFNISGIFDILLELRELFKRGVPISVAIESRLSDLAIKSTQVTLLSRFIM